MENKLFSLVRRKKTVSSLTVFGVLVLTFVFTHVWILLSFNGLYWDDWTLLTTDPANIMSMFQFTGFELLGTFHKLFYPLGVGAYKILTLFSFALMSFLAFLILRQYGFDVVQAGCVTALFIIAPLNTAKIAAINVPGTLFATVFFLAWVLLLRDLRQPRLLQRLCVLALFSMAFYFPSSLAFFALPAMSIAWHAFRSGDNWGHRLGVFFRRADFLLLPFIQFAIFRYFFFKPDASIASEYHQFGIRTSRLQEAVDRIQTDIIFDMPWVVRIVIFVLPIFVLYRFLKAPPVQKIQMVRFADLCLIVGMCASFFALLAYLAVGRLPVFSDWNSRYHLFLPLGFALVCWSICLYAAAYSRRKWFGVGTFIAIFLSSTWFSVSSYFEYADDWRKQQQLLLEMQKLSFVSPTDNIVFMDLVSYAKRRHLRHNEYTQMVLQVQPKWRALALSGSQLHALGGGSLRRYVGNLGSIESIQANPKLHGLPDQWRWNDRCVVLKIYERNGHVQIAAIEGLDTTLQPCLLRP